MTTFLLVPGLFLGAWSWDTVTAGLTERGHRAVAISLPGLGERAGEDAAAIGLAQHVDAVGEALAALDGPVVLVAHSYGSFPALAAVERAPGKVSRMVFVDTGFPESGESVATTMPHIMAAADGDVLRVPLELDAVHAVPDEAMERYRRLATPHPVRTVTDPIELTGDWRRVPTTGVFCLANGLSLEVARALHGTGDPRFAKLAEPGVTFFELNTGHYPMLSAPQELTDALVRAAAGEGLDLWGKEVRL